MGVLQTNLPYVQLFKSPTLLFQFLLQAQQQEQILINTTNSSKGHTNKIKRFNASFIVVLALLVISCCFFDMFVMQKNDADILTKRHWKFLLDLCFVQLTLQCICIKVFLLLVKESNLSLNLPHESAYKSYKCCLALCAH